MAKTVRVTGATTGSLKFRSGGLAEVAPGLLMKHRRPQPGFPPAPGRLSARGKFLFHGSEKFFARGVTYGPFAPNSRGDPFPEPRRVAADFALICELGANVVRTYRIPPAWWLDLAAQAGLRVMAGVPWPAYMMVLESPAMMRAIREEIARSVRALRPWRDTIFAYSLGNEIRADVLRYHGPRRVGRFLRELYDLGKNHDPEGLFTYSNYPSAEYLDAPFLDFICFNLFLHREADFRRQLGHLMDLCGPLPLVLSEAGADTIREGEAFQATMLGGQIRIGFEMGLAGYLIFAFTDEWHTAGAEIREWAFGIVDRDRAPKLAFAPVAAAFRALPPPLHRPPMVSIVVAACNAERTLGACLASLLRLNYPIYEVIVVDDGSIDGTAAIARSFGVRLLVLPHQGLGAARNYGIGAARGEVIAFIDADASADPDWLYHLVRALRDSGAAAVGGPNFPPPAGSAIKAAIAAAPGQPREVPGGAHRLAQLCGCNMAIMKSALDAIGGFDRDFTVAGDDVDLSLRLLHNGFAIAAAPGAVVIHERRGTVRKYLAQQIGYGRAEALVGVKHRKFREANAVLWERRLRSVLPARPRIYYGSKGRGLFQTVYSSGGIEESLALEIGWITAAAGLTCISYPYCKALGLCAALATLTNAASFAMKASLPRRQDGWRARAVLLLLALFGPMLRSAARLQRRVRLAFERPR